MQRSVSAIVPIFNEEKTLAGVLDILFESDLIAEIICINDGSTDRSLEILENFVEQKDLQRHKVKVIDFKKNHGKGFALSAGVKVASGEIVAFFDSDLLGFSNEHIRKLLEPILNGNYSAVLGVPSKSRNDFYKPWVALLTGERAYFRKDILPHIAEMCETKYGVEIFLNSLIPKEQTKIIYLSGLISPAKWIKRTPEEAVKEYILEISEIAKELSRRRKHLASVHRIIFKYFFELHKK